MIECITFQAVRVAPAGLFENVPMFLSIAEISSRAIWEPAQPEDGEQQHLERAPESAGRGSSKADAAGTRSGAGTDGRGLKRYSRSRSCRNSTISPHDTNAAL